MIATKINIPYIHKIDDYCTDSRNNLCPAVLLSEWAVHFSLFSHFHLYGINYTSTFKLPKPYSIQLYRSKMFEISFLATLKVVESRGSSDSQFVKKIILPVG